MRGSFGLAALGSGCMLVTTSQAALTEVTGVTATANDWDTRTTGYGCAPDGCVADNVLDSSLDPQSRWGCRATYSDVDVCELTFTFDQPQDISEIRMAMFKGNERNRTVNVLVDGVLTTTIVTSAVTLDLEAYELSATQATTIVLQEGSADHDDWLSVTGVQLMTESDVEVSPLTPIPTSDDYVGCFNDMVGDRVLTTVATDDSMTLEDCAAACGETSKYFYGLQQGNECWCAGCDITERDTNTDFDRHGDGICSTPCGGDPSSACGGDMVISLYQSTTCGSMGNYCVHGETVATPAPTPATSSSECPSGSTGASLEVTVSWENSYYGAQLHVVEPGGAEVYHSGKLGDVGTWLEADDNEWGLDTPGSQTYLTLNGLSAADDAVLGDYEIWATADGGSDWTITARSGGELLWVAGGVFSEFQEETERLAATVTSHADSDCTIDAYGKCPQNSYSSDGLPPCRACAPGLVAPGGSTYCTVRGLRDLELPENIAAAMVADAVGGWSSPGFAKLGEGEDYYKLFTAEGADSGTVSVSGNFARDDGEALAASAVLYLYLHNEDSETDFARGVGVLELATGDFSATVEDLPIGYGRVFLSFAVLDPADGTGGDSNDAPVFNIDVINEGCSNSLRIRLEWDSIEDLDLWVTDPNGDRTSYYNKATDIGYVNHRNGGGWVTPNPDTGYASSFEEYVVFSGLSGDAMLGEYRVFVRRDYAPSANAWTLTATLGGEVVWVEGGVFEGSSTTYDSNDDYDDDDFTGGVPTDDDDSTTSRRRLSTNDYTSSTTFYSSSSYPQSDTFTVTLDSYDPIGC